MPSPWFPTDRFLRYDELTDRLRAFADANPDLVALESIGRSHEGRELWLATVTEAATGAHDDKPAHWVDANIHSVEVAGGVAALHLLDRLVGGHRDGDPTMTRALQTRSFYVLPRLNPDGVEAALGDRPRYRRSSLRPWPWRDAHRWPGLHAHDVDGDGRVLTMRIVDPDGAWIPHPDDPRVMVPVPMEGLPPGAVRYRLLAEGTIVDHDGFTVPLPRPVEALDLNRNFPAGWSPTTTGAGDHPLSEPEIAAVVRAIGARPNICGSHAFHTYGGVLLRPHSWKPDAELPARDLWVWGQLGARATQLTGYPVHSIYEDFTWDRARPMAGAADDWAYEHLGIYSWTTELWDVIHAATGQRAPTDIWYTGPAPEHELAVARWLDEQHPTLAYVDWYPIVHPQLGPVELGGPDVFRVWDNPPPALLAAEVAPHADAVVAHALAAPHLEIRLVDCDALGERSGAFGTWRVRVGVANTGWLPTEVSARAAAEGLVLPVTVELDVPEGVAIVGSAHRVELGQLSGRSAFRLNSGTRSDGTPDRALATWLVHGTAGSELGIVARHPRAGTARAQVVLG